jgi:hypothetical protein
LTKKAAAVAHLPPHEEEGACRYVHTNPFYPSATFVVHPHSLEDTGQEEGSSCKLTCVVPLSVCSLPPAHNISVWVVYLQKVFDMKTIQSK